MVRCVGMIAMICILGTVSVGEAGKDALALSKAEQEVLDLTNQERAKEKLPALKPNATLFKVARAHSENMAKQTKMAHDLDGKKPVERVKESGYPFTWTGENIAYGSVEIAAVFKGWINSKTHRDNIMEKQYTEIGLGAVKGADGNIYYTQVFGKPRK